jgi:hypothetical protein
MFDDIKILFFEKVIPEYQGYVRIKKEDSAGRSKDVSAAINAASSLFHFREHLPEPHRKSRRALAAICPDYDLIGDITNVSKHAEIDRNNPQITKAENIYEQIVITEYRDKDGPYHVTEKTVIAELDDGTKRNVEDILTNVINMWIDELSAENLIDTLDHFPLRDTLLIPERQASGESAPLDLALTQGLGTTIRAQMMRYNYEIGKAEPIDLSDSTVSFNVYKQDAPKKTIDIIFTHTTTGEQHEISVGLSPEQETALAKLDNDRDRSEFVFRLAEEQGLLTRKKRQPLRDTPTE